MKKNTLMTILHLNANHAIIMQHYLIAILALTLATVLNALIHM